MTGFNTIALYQRLEETCQNLGFRLTKSKHNYHNYDVVALAPDQDCLPVYSRDAELFTGSLEELEVWLRGVRWARDYDQMLKVSNDKKRVKQEQLYREQQLVRLLAQPDLSNKAV
jgi:hypothetical protein